MGQVDSKLNTFITMVESTLMEHAQIFKEINKWSLQDEGEEIFIEIIDKNVICIRKPIKFYPSENKTNYLFEDLYVYICENKVITSLNEQENFYHKHKKLIDKIAKININH